MWGQKWKTVKRAGAAEGETEADAALFIGFHQPPPARVSPLSLSPSPARKSLFSSLTHLYANKPRHANETCRWGGGGGGEGKGQGEVGEDRKESQGQGRIEERRRGLRFVTSLGPNCRPDFRELPDVQHKHVNTDACRCLMTSMFSTTSCHKDAPRPSPAPSLHMHLFSLSLC